MRNESYSYIKIFKHIDKLNDIKNGNITAPIALRIKPTNKCNHRCFYCPYLFERSSEYEKGFIYNPKDEIPQDIFKGLIRDIIDMKVKSITLSGGGEPLLYKDIETHIQPLFDNDVDVAVITNGSKLDGKRAEVLASCKWVRVSIDSCDGSTYNKIRNVPKEQFDTVCNNIKHFSEIKNKDCELGINYVINHLNYKSIFESTILFKKLGVNHMKFYPSVVLDTQNYHKDLVGVSANIAKVKNYLEDEHFKIIDLYDDGLETNIHNERTYSKCPIQQIIPVIAGDSSLYVCHDKAYVSDGKIGSLKDKTFKELWFSDATKEYFNNFDAKKLCRQHCAYDQRNLIINEYLSLNDSNINYI